MPAEARVSAEIALVELEGAGQRVSAEIVLVEYGALAAYATSMLVLVELQPPSDCKPSGGYTYNGVDITAYCNLADLQLAPRELQRRTLGDTAQGHKVGLSDASMRLGGDWNAAIDALLGADARAGRRRTGEAYFDDCSMVVRYAWSEVFIAEWKVTSPASGKMQWSATLRHNGLGVRSVELS